MNATQPPGNGFVTALAEIRKGNFMAEATEKLAEVAEAVKQHGKKGSLTLKLELKLNTDGETIAVKPTCDIKVPQADVKEVTFFVDDGRLVRYNPKQPELPLKAYDGGIKMEEDRDAASQ